MINVSAGQHCDNAAPSSRLRQCRREADSCGSFHNQVALPCSKPDALLRLLDARCDHIINQLAKQWPHVIKHSRRADPVDKGTRPLDRNRFASARSEEHTSELQSLMRISYAVFCLKKKKPTTNT